MDTSRSQSALFQVYLRLRPPPPPNQLYPILTTPERFLTVEPSTAETEELPTHITLNPPNDNRRRAVEKFAFTKVFEEQASQLDLFHGTGVVQLVEGVCGADAAEGRDGLLATLGVTGSGKSHTILGSKSQRGLTQLALDLLFRSISGNILDPASSQYLHSTISASDTSEAQVMTAHGFLDATYGDFGGSRPASRAATPARVRIPLLAVHPSSLGLYPTINGLYTSSPPTMRLVPPNPCVEAPAKAGPLIPSYMCPTVSQDTKFKSRTLTDNIVKGESFSMPPPTPRRGQLQRPSVLPQLPDISSTTVATDPNAEYAIVISMYEVYNDRIFDLLTPASKSATTKDFRRRPLLFKFTEQSADRKVVSGLRKIICANVREALMVLEAGLHERRVAGTGSNSVSSRSHGFFCVEVKKRNRGHRTGAWGGSTMTVVDLAGSERARDAKTQGTTLQEAGKINESLMYLGQCLQMQSDTGSNNKPNLVPFRQCKLTELLFSNSFPSASATASSTTTSHHHHRTPQRAIMIVTADPVGDFNATSQILRYSALAREVTVPRIPSVTSTILQSLNGPMGLQSSNQTYHPYGTGRISPNSAHGVGVISIDNGRERGTMEIAAMEIARMSEEIDGLRSELADETERRMCAESKILGFEDKMMDLEAGIREECFSEMEERMKDEMSRWHARWESEREMTDSHVDQKIELLSRGLGAQDEDANGENKENAWVVESLEGENERLRREVAQLKRQMEGERSPSKKKVLGEARGFEIESPESDGATGGHGLNGQMGKLRLGAVSNAAVSAQSSPGKKIRKLTARKWNIMGDEEDMM